MIDKPISYSCQQLLSEIYGMKPDKSVTMEFKVSDNSYKELLEDLKKKKIINDLSIFHMSGWEKAEIKFNVLSWKKLDDYGEKKFNELVVEPYGLEKQKDIVKNVIIKKAIKLDNINFVLKRGDFNFGDWDHIEFLKIIDIFEKEKIIKSNGATFYIIDGNFEASIEVLINLDKYKKSNNKITGGEENKADNRVQKFRFDQGALFRDFHDKILLIKGENQYKYRLLKIALELPINERIDSLTDNLDLTFRQIYDTARQLNKEIKDIFKIDNFFEIDYSNKYIKRAVE